MLPVLGPVDRGALLGEINAAVSNEQLEHALDVVGRNPLAMFGWVNVDGVLACYLLDEPRTLNTFAGIAILFRRWLHERFSPADAAEELSLRCLTAQVDYLQYAFGRLRDLDDEMRRQARQAHQQMSRAALDRDMRDYAGALTGFARAAESWDGVGDPYFGAQVAADWAAVLEVEGELEEAVAKIDHAINVGTVLGDLERLGRRRLHRGKLRLQLGFAEEAVVDYREAEGVFRITGEHDRLTVALAAEGEVLRLLGRTDEAETAFSIAKATAKKLDSDELTDFVEQVIASPAQE